MKLINYKLVLYGPELNEFSWLLEEDMKKIYMEKLLCNFHKLILLCNKNIALTRLSLAGHKHRLKEIVF